MKTTKSKFDSLYKKVEKLAPIDAAVIYPDSEEALAGAILAAKENSIKPVFLCDKAEVQKLAAAIKEDISQYQLIDLPARDAIAQGVKMAREGKVQVILKGSVHTDELMSEVVNGERGLRIGGKRMSHCMVVDIPEYKKILIITDAALNIAPGLLEKKDITQNAIDLAQAIGIAIPKVAMLSAMETVNDKLASTLEYAALCKMAERGQIKGGVLDGPLSFDLAISEKSAAIKKIKSKVAGDADIVLVPNIESGNILFKALDYFAGANSLGLIIGVKVPIIITSRSASPVSRAGSCMLAKFWHYREKQ
jgi:phosphate acetyltransferase